MKTTYLLAAAAALALIPATATAQQIDAKTQARIDRILKKTPLIDGHNDLPWEIRENHKFSVEGLASGTDQAAEHPLMTDMARLHQGRVGAQFWSVYIPAEVTGDAAIRETIEEIDIVKRLVKEYPKDLELAYTADDIVRAHKAGRIASLIGIEGGHQIGGSLAALRQFYDLGARYMTLTHSKNNEWADSATDDPKLNGLSDFGRAVVGEMNRLGMLIDLSHVSDDVMRQVLQTSRSPVIFSHSSARALDDHRRNVPDDILPLVAKNGGVVMVNFYNGFLSEDFRKWSADESAEEARLKALFPASKDQREAGIKAWTAAHPAPVVNVGLIADHVEHIVKIAGYDNVGIGADLDGIPYDQAPQGMNSVSAYPLLFAELIRRGWSDANLSKLAGANVLRAMRQNEATAKAMQSERPSLATLEPAR